MQLRSTPRLPALLLAGALALAAATTRDAAAEGSKTASPSDPREQARTLYKRGTEAAQRGKLAEAAQLFAQAAELVPHAATHVAAGRSFLASKDEVAAADHFARALSLGAPEAERADVEATLASLRKKLGWVEVAGGEGSARLDQARSLPIPAALHGRPGKHTLRFTLADGEGHLEIELRAGEGEQAAASLVREESEPAPPPVSEPLDEPSSAGPSPLVIGGVVGLGLGVIGGGVTMGLGLAANGAKDDFLTSRSQSDFDGATSLETSTNVALGLSVGFAVVGAALVSVALLVDDEAPVEAANGGVAWRF